MKTALVSLTALAASIVFATAAETVKAPNGGRIIDSVTPHAEFFVTKDKMAEVRFLDATGKVVPPTTQVVTVVMGQRTAPTKLTFVREGEKLVSDKPVPEGKELPVVLQIRQKEGEKATTEKFNLNMALCPECRLAEYACTCDH